MPSAAPEPEFWSLSLPVITLNPGSLERAGVFFRDRVQNEKAKRSEPNALRSAKTSAFWPMVRTDLETYRAKRPPILENPGSGGIIWATFGMYREKSAV